MKKKIIFIAVIIVIALSAFGLFQSGLLHKKENGTVITSSQLEQAVNISQLSTAKFIYNGVAEKYKEGSTNEAECYIAYKADVKVGIQMEDVSFHIDNDAKTVTPILPKITVQIASLDEESISYIPKNPNIALKEVISICKEDAVKEANDSEELYQTAEENVRSVIEALLLPILDNAGYTLVWETKL